MKLMYEEYGPILDRDYEIIDVPYYKYTESNLEDMIIAMFNDIIEKNKYSISQFAHSEVDIRPKYIGNIKYDKYATFRFRIYSGWGEMDTDNITDILFRLLSDEEYAEMLLD